MKKNILIFTGVFLMAIFMYSMPYAVNSNGISMSKTESSSELKLQIKKGLYYELGKDIPFTGKMTVNYEKELVTNEGNYYTNEGNYNTRKSSFENEYIDGILKITNYYNQNGVFEYSVKKI